MFSAGPVQRMNPLNNLQVAVKNNIDIFYFGCLVPLHVYFGDDGEMGKFIIVIPFNTICVNFTSIPFLDHSLHYFVILFYYMLFYFFFSS